VTIVADRASEYRRLARDCLQVAQTIPTEEARLALVEMARVWSRLADEQAAAAMPPAPPEGSRPVIQQQEQVHPKKDGKE
jgi:hypothetical protein